MEIGTHLIVNARSQAAKDRWANPEYRARYEATIQARYKDGRVCPSCNQKKQLSDFKVKPDTWLRARACCLECSRRKALDYKYKTRYGITYDEFIQRVTAVAFSCEICGAKLNISNKGQAPHLDHNHETGVVRGILCGLCNKGLGQFRDNADLLYAAARYLETR